MNCCTSLAILVCIQLAFTGNFVWGQGCLRASKRGSDATDPPFNDNNNGALPADNNVQAIITTYKFHQDCDCVNITTWETYVQPGGGKHFNRRFYDITFQVWRPSPTVTDTGCYSLVGQNAFTSFTFSEGGFVQLSPTPPSQAFIIAQPGDVVGYYTNSRNGNDQVIQLERDNDFTVNTIWYLNLAGSSPAPGTNECPLSVGANGYLTSSTNAAPMLKISTSTISCPPSPTTSQLSPSSSSASLPAIQSSSYLTMIQTSNPSQSSAVSTSSPDMPSSGTVNAHTIEMSGPTVISLSVASTEAMSDSNAAPTSRLVSSTDLSISPTSVSAFFSQDMSTPVELTVSIIEATITPMPSLLETKTVSSSLSVPLLETIMVPRSSSGSLLETNIAPSSSSMSLLETSLALLSLQDTPLETDISPTSSVSLLEITMIPTTSSISLLETNTASLLSSVTLLETSIVHTSSSIFPLETIMSPMSTSGSFRSINSSGEVSSGLVEPSSSHELVSPTRSASSSPSMNKDVSTTVSFSSTPILVAPGSGSGGNSAVPLIAAVVVIVVLLMVISFLSLLTIIILRKKKLVRKVKLDANALDLSNPNYESSSATFMLKGQKTVSVKMVSKPLIRSTHHEPEEITYESLDNDYSYPQPQDTKFGYKQSLYASDICSNEKNGHTEALYHEVGPDVGLKSVSENTSTALPLPTRDVMGTKQTAYGISVVPPLPARNVMDTEKDGGNLYHVLESPSKDSGGTYEDPLSPTHNFKPQESTRQRDMFKNVGNYVLTEEERGGYEETKEQPNSVNSSNKLKFFVEDAIYWAPATTTSGLYSQLASKRYREIPREQIRLKNTIGSGQFGEVHRATWISHEHELELAVKTLKAGASEEDKVKFLQEAAIMGQFSHTNVIKMHGVVTLGEPVLICLEILENGDLRGYLQELNLTGLKYEDFMEAQLMFLKFARDIATGMEYLSKKSFVHRDLAARNVLLNKFLTCKVADFGMARDLMDDTYYTSSGGQIPVKWTAPEALLYKKYSTDSDVWSYGMVLFEIWSVGRKPFSMTTNSQTLRLIEKGFCQAPPPGCPKAIYELMVDCWNPKHQSRPSFSTVCQKYLKQSSEKLLYWSPENDSLSASVGICGGSLQESEKLYLNLQKKYM